MSGSKSHGSVVATVVVVIAGLSLVELALRPPAAVNPRKNASRVEKEAGTSDAWSSRQGDKGFEDDLEDDLLQGQREPSRREHNEEEDLEGWFDDEGGMDLEYEAPFKTNSAYSQTERAPAKERRELEVKLCSSRSTKSKFKKFREEMSSVSPGYDIRARAYPTPPMKSFLAIAIRIAQFIGAALALFGDIVFKFFSIPHPGWYESMKAKKLMILMGLWSGGNILQEKILSTGAFEVYYEGELIWSKLETNKIPLPENISDAISGLEE